VNGNRIPCIARLLPPASVGCCPQCGQPLNDTRLGVRMSKRKVRIFDLVRHAGANGISTADINGIVYDGKASGDLVRTHILQINDLLAGTEAQIRSVHRAYVLCRRQQ